MATLLSKNSNLQEMWDKAAYLRQTYNFRLRINYEYVRKESYETLQKIFSEVEFDADYELMVV